MKDIVTSTIIKVVATGLIIVAAAITLFYQSAAISDLSTQLQDQQSQHARLVFCHDNAVRPCDDTSIMEWNEAHPEDRFHIEATQ